MAFKDWECVIGLEIHAQLKTKSKMFSPDQASFTDLENNQIHPVSFGLPGTLPVVNKQALMWAIKAGKAFSCDIQNESVFARKNYFYPDLPKGYQVSQFDKPYCFNGKVQYYLENELKEVSLERIHMEEDAGRSIHSGSFTLVNFNRAGVPLIEIVTKPEIRSPIEAAACAKAIRRTLRYLDICDGNLEEGSLRCDCNVSVRKKTDTKLGTRVELKNINSFRFIEKALEYEVKRQIKSLESGLPLNQETRLYDSTKNQTFLMRLKEDSSDYRYFPDPDLLSVKLNSKDIESVSLPELPVQKWERFQKEYKLSFEQAEQLIEDKSFCDYFEELANKSKNPIAAYNWMMGEMQVHLKKSNQTLKEAPSVSEFSKLIGFVEEGVLSNTMAKEVFSFMWGTKRKAQDIIKEKNLKLISDESEIEKIIEDILKNSPEQVKQYKEGRTKIFGFFVGQVMKKTNNQVNPSKASQIIKKKLEQ